MLFDEDGEGFIRVERFRVRFWWRNPLFYSLINNDQYHQYREGVMSWNDHNHFS